MWRDHSQSTSSTMGRRSGRRLGNTLGSRPGRKLGQLGVLFKKKRVKSLIIWWSLILSLTGSDVNWSSEAHFDSGFGFFVLEALKLEVYYFCFATFSVTSLRRDTLAIYTRKKREWSINPFEKMLTFTTCTLFIISHFFYY